MEPDERKRLWTKSLSSMRSFLESRLAVDTGTGVPGVKTSVDGTAVNATVTRPPLSESERQRIRTLIRMIDSAIAEIEGCDMHRAARVYVEAFRRVARYSRAAAAAGGLGPG